jgi:hypothetical protein
MYIYGNIVDSNNNLSTQVLSDFPDLYGQNPAEAHHSVYRYDKSILNPLPTPPAIRVVGIYYHFDSPDGITALKDTYTFIHHHYDLRAGNMRPIRVYFSGNKSFHIWDTSIDEWNIGKNLFPTTDEIAEICKGTVTALKISTLKSDCSHLLLTRTINSQHPKTELFKVPITTDEILDKINIKQIKKLAKQQRTIK